MKSRSTRLALAIVAVLALITSNIRAQGDQSYAPVDARKHAGSRQRPLTGPSNASPVAIVAQYLRGIGRNVDVQSLVGKGGPGGRNGLRSLRIEQRVGGVTLYGAYAKASLTAEGELVDLIENLFAGGGGVGRPRVSEADALAAALKHLYPDQSIATGRGRRQGDTVRFERTAFFHDEPTVTRVAYPAADGSLGAGFLVHTWTDVGNLLHETLVGSGGEVLFDELRTNQDTYRIFPISPKLTPTQSDVPGPGTDGDPATFDGWLFDVAQSSIDIAGNNVNAYLDANANNSADTDDESTTISDGQFLATANLSQAPGVLGNREVAVQNLFYLNNVVHDALYAKGFDEANGNFQEHNFGLGGEESDSVNAEAQDGAGTDNANFATPADGSNPRMQMFLFNAPGDHQVVSGSTFEARAAAFGPALTTPFSGTLADYTDGDFNQIPDGCTALSSLSGRIAVIRRGTCDFIAKVLNAQAAGAVAVIMVNNDQEDPDEEIVMGGSGRKPKIPSVMVSFNSGAALTPNTAATLRKTDPAPLMLDGDLDADVVFHEYGHGLTWRLIGGMSGPLAGAIGEGGGDTLAFLMTRASPGADAIGEYTEGNGKGIRSHRYSLYPAASSYADATQGEVHADGEIYAAIMWDLLELYEANGKTSDDLFARWVDGMKSTPATPKFEDMRDGMLASAEGTDEECLIWRAFAARGVGVGASATVKGKNVTINETFTLPAECPAPPTP